MALVDKYVPIHKLYEDLQSMGRTNFSYSGAEALMEYLENLSEEMEEDIAYDPIAFCCEYSEYDFDDGGEENLFSEYGHLMAGDMADINDLVEELRDHTTVIEFDNGIILQAF